MTVSKPWAGSSQPSSGVCARERGGEDDVVPPVELGGEPPRPAQAGRGAGQVAQVAAAVVVEALGEEVELGDVPRAAVLEPPGAR